MELELSQFLTNFSNKKNLGIKHSVCFIFGLTKVIFLPKPIEQYLILKP